MKKQTTKIFIEEIYSKASKRNYPTNRIIYNHVDETWSIDLADMVDYKFSNNKGFRYIFVIINNFSKNTLCIPLKKIWSNSNKRVFKYSIKIKTKTSQDRI